MSVGRDDARPAVRALVALSLLGVGAGTAAVVAWSGASFAALASLPPENHGLALLATAADVLLRGMRFVILGVAMGVSVPWSLATLSQLGGDGLGALTPARSGSDPAKALILLRGGVDIGTAGALLVGEAVAEALLLPPLAIALVLLLDVPGAALSGPLAWSAVSLSLAVAAVVLVPARAGSVPVLLRRFGVTPDRWGRIVRGGARFRSALASLRHLGPRPLALLALATVGHVAGRLLTLPALLVDVPAALTADEGSWPGWGVGPELGALIGWPFLLLYGGALVPVPGGGGLLEMGFATVLGDVITGPRMGVLAFWWRFYTFHLTAAGGLLVVLWINLASRKSAASSPEVTPGEP